MPPRSIPRSDSSDSLTSSDSATNVVKRKRAETIGKSALARAKRNRASTITANSESETTDASGVINLDDDEDEIDEIVTPGVQSPQTLEWVQERLALKAPTWVSSVYQHFATPPDIVNRKGLFTYEFMCKTTGTKLLRSPTDSSTSNLQRHVSRCLSDPTSGSIELYAHGSTYSPGRLRLYMVEEVTVHHRPFALFEDAAMIKIIKMFNPMAHVFVATTISKDSQEIHTLTKAKVVEMLASVRNKVHLVFDAWASGNKRSCQGLALVYWLGEDVHVINLDMIALTEAHTGAYLAKVNYAALESFNVVPKLLGQTGDNASVNHTLVEKLAGLLPENSAASVDTFVGCFAHVLDLSCRAGLVQFIGKKLATVGLGDYNEDDDADEEGDMWDPETVDELDEEEREFMDGVDVQRELDDEEEAERLALLVDEVTKLTAREIKLGKTAITKIMKLGWRIFNSEMLQDELKTQCILAGIEPRKMIRAVATRWNSLHPVLERAISLRNALDALCLLSSSNKNRKKKLSRFKLTGPEWTVIVQLEQVLKLFVLASKHMCQSAVPLLHEVIPIMDMLVDQLEVVIDDKSLHAVIRAAAARSRVLVLKYYSKTDKSRMYRIAMILHPRFKTSYFRSRRWESDWIVTATEMVEKQWRLQYKPVEPAPIPTVAPTAEKVNNPFALAGNFGLDDSADALEQYLQSPPMANVTDPLRYWSAMLDKAGSKVTSNGALAMMALDYLTVPATSVDVERMFSHAGLTVTKHRHNLSDASTRAAVILGSWFKKGLVPEKEVIQIFNDKPSRAPATLTTSKGKGKADVTVIDD